jgi:hypothetical protein
VGDRTGGDVRSHSEFPVEERHHRPHDSHGTSEERVTSHPSMLGSKDKERQGALLIVGVEGEQAPVVGVLAGDEFEVSPVATGDTGFQAGFGSIPGVFDGGEQVGVRGGLVDPYESLDAVLELGKGERVGLGCGDGAGDVRCPGRGIHGGGGRCAGGEHDTGAQQIASTRRTHLLAGLRDVIRPCERRCMTGQVLQSLFYRKLLIGSGR